METHSVVEKIQEKEIEISATVCAQVERISPEALEITEKIIEVATE